MRACVAGDTGLLTLCHCTCILCAECFGLDAVNVSVLHVPEFHLNHIDACLLGVRSVLLFNPMYNIYIYIYIYRYLCIYDTHTHTLTHAVLPSKFQCLMILTMYAQSFALDAAVRETGGDFELIIDDNKLCGTAEVNMCVCVCVCIYIYVCVYIYMCVYIYIYIYILYGVSIDDNNFCCTAEVNSCVCVYVSVYCMW